MHCQKSGISSTKRNLRMWNSHWNTSQCRCWHGIKSLWNPLPFTKFLQHTIWHGLARIQQQQRNRWKAITPMSLFGEDATSFCLVVAIKSAWKIQSEHQLRKSWLCPKIRAKGTQICSSSVVFIIQSGWVFIILRHIHPSPKQPHIHITPRCLAKAQVAFATSVAPKRWLQRQLAALSWDQSLVGTSQLAGKDGRKSRENMCFWKFLKGDFGGITFFQQLWKWTWVPPRVSFIRMVVIPPKTHTTRLG